MWDERSQGRPDGRPGGELWEDEAPCLVARAFLGPGVRFGLLMLRVVAYVLVAMVGFAFVVHLVH